MHRKTFKKESQALPLLLDTSNWFGTTCPISEDMPNEDDLRQTRNMVDFLKSCHIFETDAEQQHREKVIKRLESLYKEWLTETCEAMNLPEVVTAKVGGKIFPFGSYHLGAQTKGSDIDILCVGPEFLSRKDFFTSFYEKLKAQKEVKDLRAVEEAFVPVIHMSYDGIEIDLLVALVAKSFVPANMNLLDDKMVKGLSKQCVRSLNGFRVTEEILRSVPNIFNFQLTLRAIKYWAKRRGIYSNKLGFLGGVSWAIMVARVCQLYPNATAATLVNKFFKLYNMWEWPVPILLKRMVDPGFNLPVWNPRINRGDRSHLMPVLTPAYPQQNSTCNVSQSSFEIIKEEIKRGYEITENIRQKKENWSNLFETSDFSDKYKHYILLELSSATPEEQQDWANLFESKFRFLVRTLDSNPHFSRAHLNLQSSGLQSSDGRVSTFWMIGLVFNTELFKYKSVNLHTELQPFMNHVRDLVVSDQMDKKGATLKAMYLLRENQTWKIPKKNQWFFRPQRITQTKPISDTAPNLKRKAPLQPLMPAKKMRANKELHTVTCSSSVSLGATTPLPDTQPEMLTKKIRSDTEARQDPSAVPVTEVMNKESVNPSVKDPSTSQSTKRTGTHEPVTPNKKPKLHLSEPEKELPDMPPSFARPTTISKRTIKLNLVRAHFRPGS